MPSPAAAILTWLTFGLPQQVLTAKNLREVIGHPDLWALPSSSEGTQFRLDLQLNLGKVRFPFLLVIFRSFRSVFFLDVRLTWPDSITE